MEKLTNYEFYINEFNKNEKDWEKQENGIKELRIKNLEYLRSFWANLSVLSAMLVVGMFVYSIDNLAYFVLVIFGLIQILFTYYINQLLTNENNDLSKLNDFYQRGFKENSDLIKKYKNKNPEEYMRAKFELVNKLGEEEIKVRGMSSKDKWLMMKVLGKHFSDIVSVLFILGVVIMILSFFFHIYGFNI